MDDRPPEDGGAHGGLLRFLDALGLGAVAFAGCSLGGPWGLAYALRHPDSVSHLVLIGTPSPVRLPTSPSGFGSHPCTLWIAP